MNSFSTPTMIRLMLVVAQILLSAVYAESQSKAEADESPPASKIRVSCIGDSITQGNNKSRSFTIELQQLLGESLYAVSNFGVGAMTMSKNGQCEPNGKVADHFRKLMFDKANAKGCSYWDTTAWVNAKASKPNIVTIMMGTNDAKWFNWEKSDNNTAGEQYIASYRDMIHVLQALQPKPRIFIMTSPPMYKHLKFHISETVVNTVLPDIVKRIAREENVELIDIYTAFRNEKDQSGLTYDHCHPSKEGSSIIAKAVAGAILRT